MNLRDFKQQIKPYKAILGFDFGTKRLGVAVSDLLWTVATPQKTIFRSDWNSDLKAIRTLIAEKEVGALVYGLPLQMNGEEGDTAKAVRGFAQKLAQEIPLPYAFWDERLSSRAMENFLIKEVDMSRAKRKDILDSSSAAYILQGVLDALHYL